jgi:hypothetical protein
MIEDWLLDTKYPLKASEGPRLMQVKVQKDNEATGNLHLDKLEILKRFPRRVGMGSQDYHFRCFLKKLIKLATPMTGAMSQFIEKPKNMSTAMIREMRNLMFG